MKITVSLLLSLLLLAFTSVSLFAQNKKITVILLRHAEKDISAGADKVDPALSPEGKQRAERLVEKIKRYKPDAIYSSNFQRTRFTAVPLAEKLNSRYRQQIQIYDHTRLEDLVDRLLASNARTVVVVGHNTTTPALANLLIKQDKYKALSESEYDKIWVIEIKKNKIKEKIVEY